MLSTKKICQSNNKKRKESTMNALDLFLTAPNQETFKAIQGNAWILTRVFQKNEELAKNWFKFGEWFKICQDLNSFDDDEKTKIRAFLKSSVSSFDEAIKYYYSLGYDDRMAWQQDFINHAKTVENLRFVLHQVNQKYRKEIIEKMRNVAASDEEKKIAYSYAI